MSEEAPEPRVIYSAAGHSIDENWVWLVRSNADGSKELVGVQYPNGDQRMAADMPEQQWKAYLRKGRLTADSRGRLSINDPN